MFLSTFGFMPPAVLPELAAPGPAPVVPGLAASAPVAPVFPAAPPLEAPALDVSTQDSRTPLVHTADGQQHAFDVLYPMLAIIPFAFVTLSLAHSRAHMIGSAILFGIGFGGAYPAFATFVLDNTDPRRRARTFGSIVWAFDTGIGAGSFLIGAIGEHRSLGFAFMMAAIVSCLAIPIFEFASRGLIADGTPLAADLDHAGTD